MKIQINSLEALERLIGGDTQVEIEIRNSIVQEFTKKYLKSLVSETLANQVIKEAVKVARHEIEKEFFTLDTSTFYSKVALKKEIREKLIEIVKQDIYKEVYEELNLQEVKQELLNTAAWAKTEALKKYTDERVYSEITEKIRKELLSKL